MYTVFHVKNGRCLVLKDFKIFHNAVDYRNKLIESNGGNKENDYYTIGQGSYKDFTTFYGQE